MGYKLTVSKLSNLVHPDTPSKHARIYEGDTFIGSSKSLPKVGARLLLDNARTPTGDYVTYFHSTTVKSLYKHGSSADKLVLPTGFPDAVNLKLPEMGKGEYLIATKNSVYYIKDVKRIPEPKKESIKSPTKRKK